MVASNLKYAGVFSVIVLLVLFVFFISSDIDNGPVPYEKGSDMYERALEGETRATCSLIGDSERRFNKGKLLVAKETIRFNFKGTQGGSVIMTPDNDLYIWMDDSEDGVLISEDQESHNGSFIKKGEFSDISFEDYFHKVNKKGEMECERGSFDLALLEVPDNINFIRVPKKVSVSN